MIHRVTHHLFRLPKFFLTLLLLVILTTGVLFIHESVYAQSVGGRILYFDNAPVSPTFNRHTVGPPFPMLVYCPMCMGPLGIGRLFLGNAVGGVVIVGALGGF